MTAKEKGRAAADNAAGGAGLNDADVEMSAGSRAESVATSHGEAEQRTEGKIPLCHVRLMTALILLLRIASHYDGGVLAALYGDEEKQLKNDQGLSSTQQGLIVTLGFVGLITGCLVSGSVMSSVPSKRLIQASGVILIFGTGLFAAAQGVWMMYLARLLVGFGQSLQTVLYPVWADEFAPPGGASGYLAALQAGGPLGIVFGYLITGLTMANTDLSWRWAFIFQGILMLVPMAIFVFIPLRYVECNKVKEAAGEGEGEGEGDDVESAPRSETTAENEARPHPKSKREVLLEIMSNGVIWCATMVLSSLYFVVNGMQTWVTDYITSPNSTVEASENTVIATFGITAATAPVSGIVVGGLVLAKLGGYRHYPSRTTLAGLVQGVFATLFAYASLFMNSFVGFMTMIWLVLFFGGAMVPGMVGLIVTSVAKEHRSLVSAFASFVYNLLGYALGPLAAGVVADQFESEDFGIIWGFRVVMGWSAVALVLQGIVCILWRLQGVAEPRLDEDELAALAAEQAAGDADADADGAVSPAACAAAELDALSPADVALGIPSSAKRPASATQKSPSTVGAFNVSVRAAAVRENPPPQI